MDDKVIINDTLSSIKSTLIKLEKIIIQTYNLELRQILIQKRNNYEDIQYELYKIAKLKKYYNENSEIKPLELAEVRKQLLK